KASEWAACKPAAVDPDSFNPNGIIPLGCTTKHLYQSMTDFLAFLQLINEELHNRQMIRLESLLMPANFSSIVGEFIIASLPKYCSTLAKNTYHNGHPDLVPAGRFPNDAAQYTHEGIEVKASRYHKGWQGHNAEESWLMIFVFDSNRPTDFARGVNPKPFRFLKVIGAPLTLDDWKFSGRSAESRRTITASVTPSGYAKLEANWLYRAPTTVHIPNVDLDVNEDEDE
ncbi:MAG TPA: hypothetical protein VMV29_19885, partial [Ktedonobacterales bacterium]|nr:hypothetical protein [Ktedonobacterales bacterium]